MALFYSRLVVRTSKDINCTVVPLISQSDIQDDEEREREREMCTMLRYICLQSEDSMEHLSAEERACLMYLEQTIEALEVQEDSGLSNDEPDSAHPPENMGPNKVNGI